jgi:hypothetical protein
MCPCKRGKSNSNLGLKVQSLGSSCQTSPPLLHRETGLPNQYDALGCMRIRRYCRCLLLKDTKAHWATETLCVLEVLACSVWRHESSFIGICASTRRYLVRDPTNC